MKYNPELICSKITTIASDIGQDKRTLSHLINYQKQLIKLGTETLGGLISEVHGFLDDFHVLITMHHNQIRNSECQLYDLVNLAHVLKIDLDNLEHVAVLRPLKINPNYYSSYRFGNVFTPQSHTKLITSRSPVNEVSRAYIRQASKMNIDITNPQPVKDYVRDRLTYKNTNLYLEPPIEELVIWV